MTSAAVFLVTRSLVNALRRSAARLRQPRYVMGFALALFYLWTAVYRRGSMPAAALRQQTYPEMMSLVIAFIALIIVVGAWAMPGNAPGLVFSEAEIQFLFAGPVSRRQLLAYKVLRSQLQSIFSAFIFSFFVFRGGRFLGMWAVMAALDVYLTCVSFVRARLATAGVRWWMRAVAVSIFATALATLISQQVRANGPELTEALRHSRRNSFIFVLAKVLDAPPLSTILYFPRIIGHAVFSASPWLPIAIVLAIAVALFFLTTQLDVAFEDASIVASQRALTRRARMRGMRGGRGSTAVNRFPPPFKLAEQGRPEVALIWKNMTGALRITAFPIIAIVLPALAALAAAIFRREGVADLIGLMGLMSTGIYILTGPPSVRTDLRTDILRLDVIKTFPLSAEALLIGELGASLIVIAFAEMLMLLTSVTILQFGGHYFRFATTPEFLVCAIVFIIPVTAIQLLIQNGAIILFPAWNLGSDGERFSAMGQRLLFLLGNVLTLSIALLPAAALFIPGFVLAQKFSHGSALGIFLATIPAVAVLVAEIYVALKFLANQFEGIDVANDVAGM
jgi:hypothetical protein